VDLPQKRRQIFIHDDMNRFFWREMLTNSKARGCVI
jgi:hypothetical protein